MAEYFPHQITGLEEGLGISREKLTVPEASQILVRYGVKVVFPFSIGGKDGILPKLYPILDTAFTKPFIDNETREACIVGIAQELIYYPVDFFKRNKIEKFYIETRDDVAGYSEIFRKRIGFSWKTFKRKDGLIRADTFHHEVFHTLERFTQKGNHFEVMWNNEFIRRISFNELFYSLIKKPYQADQNDFRFDWWKIPPSEWKERYISNYGAQNPSEDRASTASILFISPEHFINTMMKNPSEIIKRKFSYVLSFYYDISGGKMDANFWADFVQGKVDRNYWRTRRY